MQPKGLGAFEVSKSGLSLKLEAEDPKPPSAVDTPVPGAQGLLGGLGFRV